MSNPEQVKARTKRAFSFLARKARMPSESSRAPVLQGKFYTEMAFLVRDFLGSLLNSIISIPCTAFMSFFFRM